MHTKEDEIAEFRKKHLFYTKETKRKMQADELIQQNARNREILYDLIINGLR